MDADERLARALAADRPKAEDGAFVLAALRQAEARRWRARTLRAALIGAGVAAPAALLALSLGGPLLLGGADLWSPILVMLAGLGAARALPRLAARV